MKLNLSTLLGMLLTLTLANCQKEDENFNLNQEELSKTTFIKRSVSINEIPSVKDYVESKRIIVRGQKTSDGNDAIFDVEDILETIDTLNNTNYSFNFRFPDTPIGVFYNLVIGVNSNGEFSSPYVLKYECDENELGAYIEGGLRFENFKGTVSLHKYTDYFALDYFDKVAESNCPTEFDEFGDPIQCETQPVDGSGTGGGGDSGVGGDNSGTTGGTGGGIDSGGSFDCDYMGIYVMGCGGTNTDSLHPIGSCQGPNQDEADQYAVWDCGGGSQKSTSTSDCPECNTSDGGVGVNTVTFTEMSSALKYGLDLSLAGMSFITDSDNAELVSLIYYFLEARISPVTNDYSDEAKIYATEIIESAADSTLVTASPFVKYPVNSNYETLYPKLTSLLKDDLPKIANNQKIIDAIHGITEAPKETIKEALKWGKGPTIQIQQLGGEGEAEKLGSYRGHLSDEFLNTLFLDIDLVNDFENSNAPEMSDALAFLIAVTVLHEYTHLGDVVFGDNFWGELYSNEDYDPDNEAGLVFEDMVFGEHIWRENAGVVLRRTGGLFND